MDTSQYPVRFAVDYPDRTLDRVTTFFRIIEAILVVLGAVPAGAWSWTSGNGTMTGP